MEDLQDENMGCGNLVTKKTPRTLGVTLVAKIESLCASPNLLDESSKAENLPWDLAES